MSQMPPQPAQNGPIPPTGPHGPAQHRPGPPPGFATPGNNPPQQKRKGKGCLIVAAILGGLLVLGVIGGALGGGSSTSARSGDATSNAAATTAAQKSTAAQLPGIGAAVTSGDVEYTVTAFACDVSVTNYSGAITPQGKWCKLDVTVKNVGKQKVTVTDDFIKVKDAAGVEYSTGSETVMVDGTIFLKGINPGNSIQGTAYFDVPKDAAPVTAVLKGGYFAKSVDVAVA